MDSPQLQGDSGPRSRMSEEAHSIGTEQVISGIEKDKILTESKASNRTFWLLQGHNAVNNSMLKQPGVQAISSCEGENDTFTAS